MMQDAWRDNWQPRNVFPSSHPATSSLGVSLAINPLENRWPIKSCVQGEPPLINADCQGASLMYFSFKESVSNAHCFGGVLACPLWAEREVQGWRETALVRDSFLILSEFYGWRYLLVRRSQKSGGKQVPSVCQSAFNLKEVFKVFIYISTAGFDLMQFQRKTAN